MARFSTFRFAPPADGLVVSAPSIRSQIPPVASGLPPLPRGVRQWGQAAKAALWSRCAPPQPPPPQIPRQQSVRYPSPHLCVSQCTTARASTSGSRPNETRASHAASAAAPCARHELQRDGEMHRPGRRGLTPARCSQGDATGRGCPQGGRGGGRCRAPAPWQARAAVPLRPAPTIDQGVNLCSRARRCARGGAGGGGGARRAPRSSGASRSLATSVGGAAGGGGVQARGVGAGNAIRRCAPSPAGASAAAQWR